MMSEGERMEKQDSLQPIVLERQKFDLDDIREMHTFYKEAMAAKEQIILNSINVLMKRGIYGLAIYAVNDNLKRKLQKMKVEAMQDDI
ncbi:DNA/RNA helicase domain-containing protein [Aerococcus viridans]|uniref:DNA/RNA helicase domain-containing protein n=2 Tax=Aerococcus TaxID=1375 RepID=UPI000CF5B98A